ncbi:hypothetical protein D3C87_125200 [compost metagenome]
MPFNSKTARQSINQTFGLNDTAPAYADWAKMQQAELDERAGDGYSPWEYMTDSLLGAPEMGLRRLRDLYDGGSQQSGKMDGLLEKMRGISDKGKGYQPSRQEREAMSAWEMLKTKGKAPSGY